MADHEAHNSARSGGQQPLEMILARNLLTSVSTPGFLVGPDASLLFFNEAAAALLGRAFEDVGRMTAEEWSTAFGPLDEEGTPLDGDRLSATEAIDAGRPAHGEFRLRRQRGETIPIEASTFPIVGPDGDSSGAMILFWSLDELELPSLRSKQGASAAVEAFEGR